MAQVISDDELPNSGSVHKFEGYLYGDVDVSVLHTCRWLYRNTEVC
jgi:hypothetical protein